MALNLSKKVENVAACSPTGGDDSMMADKSMPDGGFEPNNSSGVCHQPLDLSLKVPERSHQRKRLMPWSIKAPTLAKVAAAAVNSSSDHLLAIRHNLETGPAVDEDGDDDEVRSNPFDDNPNENGAYTCHYCEPSASPAIFQTWASVQAHFQTCHPNERPYACPLAPSCPYSTKWFCDMRVHFRRHHPEIASSPRQLYDAIQIVKDRTTMSPVGASSVPASSVSDSLLMIVRPMPERGHPAAATGNGHHRGHDATLSPTSPPTSISSTSSSSQFFNHLNHNQNQNRHQQPQKPANHNKVEFQDPPFWARAVTQQRSSDIRSVKAIKIDCRSVHKALNNHRQQQEQEQESQLRNNGSSAWASTAQSPLRANGNALNSSSSHPGNGAQGFNQHGLIPPSPRSVPYKFQCPLCNYRTQRQTNFECHVACHENLRIYKCSACAYRSNWKWDLKKHIRQVHPIIIEGDGPEEQRRQQQPVEKILIGKMEEGDSIDGDHVEGAAKILVMPLEEARRTVDTYLKQVGKSAEKFLLKCILCPFVTKRRKLLTRHHQQTHGLRPEECCNTDEFVMALPSSPSSHSSGGEADDSPIMPNSDINGPTLATNKSDVLV